MRSHVQNGTRKSVGDDERPLRVAEPSQFTPGPAVRTGATSDQVGDEDQRAEARDGEELQPGQRVRRDRPDDERDERREHGDQRLFFVHV